MELFKNATRDNMIVDMLSIYIENPSLIPSITTSIFELYKETIQNVPIMLADLKEFLVKRHDDNLDRQAFTYKSRILSLDNAVTDFKTEYISKKWHSISRGIVKGPQLTDLESLSAKDYFPNTYERRLMQNIKEIDETNANLDLVSDYWKIRCQHTTDFLTDLRRPLPHGEASKHLPNYVQALLKKNQYERIPYIKINKKEEK